MSSREVPLGTYLSKRGYVIKKESLDQEELDFLRKNLIARPLQDDKYNTYNKTDVNYNIYTETKNKLYIPKMYGITRYGNPNKFLPNYIGKVWDNDSVNFNGILFPNQIEPVNALVNACRENGGGILKAATGTGKCHKIDTEILMFDGKIKLVQDIVIGDLLMGDDSTPRRVLSLARGRDIMYDIIPTKGEKYTVNQEHILCLKVSSNPTLSKSNVKNRWEVRWFENFSFKSRCFKINDKLGAVEFMKTIKQQKIVEISVTDYVKLPKCIRHVLKGYKVAIEFDEKPLNFDPYIIGLWLGDGTFSSIDEVGKETSIFSQITNQDSIILHYLKTTLPKFGCYLQYKSEKNDKNDKNTYVYNINGSGSGKPDSNNFLNELKSCNLINNKHIPDIYKYNSRENRLQLLAGIIDSDGYLDKGCVFEIIKKSEKMIDDIIYLCRSLGFSCYKSKQKKGCWYKGEYKSSYYYRICISGHTDIIPTRCVRKRAHQRRQIKDVLVTGITVKRLDYDDYYGFEIDGNNRYVLGDFTVTHNTFMAINVLSKLKTKTIVVVNKIPLMRQWESEIRRFLPGIEVGFIQGKNNVKIDDCDIVIAMLQSLARIEYPDSFFEGFGCVVMDECHNTSSRVFSQVLGKLCCKYTIGLSATPKRSDGCEYVFKYHIGDIIYESNCIREGLAPILKFVKIDSSDYEEVSVTNKITGQKQIQFTSMLSELIKMPKRNKLVLEMIKDLVNREKRKILVLSDRRDHLKDMKNLLDEDNSVTFTYGLFLGQMKQTELLRSRSSQVILATFSAFGEGVSERELDTLILITPKKFIGHLKNSVKAESGKLEQIVGRIFRKSHTERNPLIVDLHDNFSVYKNQSSQRKIFYKNHFENASTIYTQINLDDHEIENIDVKCLKITKKSKNIDEESNNVNTTTELLKHCVIED